MLRSIIGASRGGGVARARARGADVSVETNGGARRKEPIRAKGRRGTRLDDSTLADDRRRYGHERGNVREYDAARRVKKEIARNLDGEKNR